MGGNRMGSTRGRRFFRPLCRLKSSLLLDASWLRCCCKLDWCSTCVWRGGREGMEGMRRGTGYHGNGRRGVVGDPPPNQTDGGSGLPLPPPSSSLLLEVCFLGGSLGGRSRVCSTGVWRGGRRDERQACMGRRGVGEEGVQDPLSEGGGPVWRGGEGEGGGGDRGDKQAPRVSQWQTQEPNLKPEGENTEGRC